MNPNHCEMGEHCACARVGKAFRFIAPARLACASPSPKRVLKAGFSLSAVLVLSLLLAYGLDRSMGDLGAVLGLLLGLSMGAGILRYNQF